MADGSPSSPSLSTTNGYTITGKSQSESYVKLAPSLDVWMVDSMMGGRRGRGDRGFIVEESADITLHLAHLGLAPAQLLHVTVPIIFPAQSYRQMYNLIAISPSTAE